MSKSKVAILRTTPATVLEDYHRAMNLADYQEVIAKDAGTLAKWQSLIDSAKAV